MRGPRILTVAVTLAAAACGPTSTPTPMPSTTNAPLPTVSSVPASSATPEPQPARDAVLQDAASHLGVSPDQLRVTQLEPRQWPDSSLGCPQPGTMYSQIVTPGFLIVVTSASGKQLEYHTDARSRVVLCTEN